MSREKSEEYRTLYTVRENCINEYHIDKNLQKDPFRDDYTLRVKTRKYVTDKGEVKEARKVIFKVEK